VPFLTTLSFHSADEEEVEFSVFTDASKGGKQSAQEVTGKYIFLLIFLPLKWSGDVWLVNG
jgi:hypothetical protein